MTERSVAHGAEEEERYQLKSDEQEQRNEQVRDHLYEALAALSIDERISTINRMAERMGV